MNERSNEQSGKDPELYEGSVDVVRDRHIIKVIVTGWMSESLTESLQAQVEAELLKEERSHVLYDGMDMDDPSLAITLVMQTFTQRLSRRVSKIAIVVPGYRLAYLARLAFGQDDERYRVFYNNREEALAWLESA